MGMKVQENETYFKITFVPYIYIGDALSSSFLKLNGRLKWLLILMKTLTLKQYIKELVLSLNAHLNCPRTNNFKMLGLSLRLKKL